MRAMQGDMTISPQGFKRNIQYHSTPLNVNAAGNSNGTRFSNRSRGRKRKLVESSPDFIDLTPKKFKLPTSNFTINDSDVEIIEPEPPTVIDLVEDDNCNELTNVNSPADITAVTNLEENQNTSNSENKDVAISVDSIESITELETLSETPKAIETPRAIETPKAIETLYIKDAIGGGSLQPPLYDIVSDDSFCFDSTSVTPVSSQEFSQRTLVADVDDSVIFVSEIINPVKPPTRFPQADDFIPINNRGYNSYKRVMRNTRILPGGRILPNGRLPKLKSPKNGEIKNPNQNQKAITPVTSTKRMVLIDGNNVAFNHARNKEFSVEGIAICLDYFLEKGYDATAIVPQMRMKKAKSTNQDLLAKLESEGKVILSPCKNLPNGQKVTSYDDRFILDFAADCDAAVISNDNYRDLSKENEKYRDIINSRVIGFTFFKDIIKFPQDPYGKFGPSLDNILNGKGQK